MGYVMVFGLCVAVLATGFAFGFATAWSMQSGFVWKYRRDARNEARKSRSLVTACRETLSDGWLRKVERRANALVDAEIAREEAAK